jgi:hypothetical protein
MQVFERRDAVEAEMRQQVDPYSHTLASALIAAVYLPPPWLLPPRAAAATQGDLFLPSARCVLV